jgi:hypothetical protein
MGEKLAPVPPEQLPPEQPQGRADSDLAISKRRRWLLAGFIGWYIVNGLFWLIYKQIPLLDPRGSTFVAIDYLNMGILTTIINVIALIVLALIRRTRWIALGVLGAWAVNLAVSLVLGLLFNALCLTPFFTPLR